MKEEEAIALIVKITGRNESKIKLKELVNILGCLPLALAQAGAYMAEKQTNVDDYLTLYRQYKLKIMKDDTLSRNPKHDPVWITFDMTSTTLWVKIPVILVTAVAKKP